MACLFLCSSCATQECFLLHLHHFVTVLPGLCHPAFSMRRSLRPFTFLFALTGRPELVREALTILRHISRSKASVTHESALIRADVVPQLLTVIALHSATHLPCRGCPRSLMLFARKARRIAVSLRQERSPVAGG